MRNDKEKFRKWAARKQCKYEQWFKMNACRPKRPGRLNLSPIWQTAVRIALILTYRKGATGVGGGSRNDHLKRLLYEYWPEIYPSYTLAWTSHVASALSEIRKNPEIFGSVPHIARRKQVSSGYRKHRAFMIPKESKSLSFGQTQNVQEGVVASTRSMIAQRVNMVRVYDAILDIVGVPPNLRDAVVEAKAADELGIEADIKVLKAIQELAA